MKRRYWILIGIFVICFIASCLVGRYELSLRDIGEILLGKSTNRMQENVFLKIRLSRTCLAALSGAALALSGLVYQSIFKNPLISPDVLGVGSGCSVGAIAALLLTGGVSAWMQASAFGVGVCTVGFTILLSKAIGGIRNVSMILAGIVSGALANAVIMMLKYAADPQRELAAIEYWLMGSFASATWADVVHVLPVIAGCSILLFFLRWQIKMVSLGDEEARSLGTKVGTVKLLAIFGATGLVAAVVSVCGLVAWTGLIVPHMVKILFRENILENYWEAVLTGASFMLVADMLSRSLFAAELPISIMTSFMGAVFLGMILLRKKKRWAE